MEPLEKKSADFGTEIVKLTTEAVSERVATLQEPEIEKSSIALQKKIVARRKATGKSLITSV